MPKHRNNKSQKSTSSTSTANTTPSIAEDDDGFGGLLKLTKPSSRRLTPKSTSPARPEFLEPLSPIPVVLTPLAPPPTPWEVLGMTEDDFLAMQERLFQRYREIDRQIYIQNMIDDLDDPSYWLRRIESLEREREFFNKKRGWSATEIACVERIDAKIKECEDELDRLYSEEDRIEAEYD